MKSDLITSKEIVQIEKRLNYLYSQYARCNIDKEKYDFELKNILNYNNLFIIEEKEIIPLAASFRINPLMKSILDNPSKAQLKYLFNKTFIGTLACCFNSYSPWRMSIDMKKGMIHLISKSSIHHLSEQKQQRLTPSLNDRQIGELLCKLFDRKLFFRNRIRGISQKMRYDIFERDNYTCVMCKSKGIRVSGRELLHLDHIIPINLGGSNDKSNLQTLCSDCNLRKSDKIYSMKIMGEVK